MKLLAQQRHRPPANVSATRLNRKSPFNATAVSLVVLAAAAAVWILQAAQQLFVPVVLAVLASYALNPIVSGLEKLKVPRFIGAGLLLLALSGALSLGAYALSDDALGLVEDLPNAAQKLRQAINARQSNEEGVIDKVQEAASAIESTALDTVEPGPAARGVMRVQIEEKPIDLSGLLFWGSAGILSSISSLIFLAFLVYFFLISGNLYRRKLVKIAGASLAKRKITNEILDEIHSQVQRFVIVQVFTSIAVAIASTVAFYGVGLERAMIWGLAAGIFNSIPYFGPILVTGGVALVAFLQFGSLEMAAYLGLIAAAITTLEGFLLTPWLTGRAARINGVALFVGLMFWGWVWGALGILLAVPMMVIVKSICDRVEDLKPIGELLGE